MKNFLLSATLCGLCLLPAQAQEAISKLNITGEGIIYVVPDRVDLYFGVRSEGVVVDRVKKENDSLVSGLLTVLKDLDIDKKDIRTEHMSLQKYYDHRQEKEQYRATQNLVVRIKNLEDYTDITAALLSSGVNQIDRVEFGHSDLRALEDRAREAAVKDGIQKMNLYSKALGLEPGVLLLLEEEGSSPPAPIYRMAKSESYDAGGPALAPGELNVTRKIRMVFSLK